jgi:hypothetical protein
MAGYCCDSCTQKILSCESDILKIRNDIKDIMENIKQSEEQLKIMEQGCKNIVENCKEEGPEKPSNEHMGDSVETKRVLVLDKAAARRFILRHLNM